MSSETDLPSRFILYISSRHSAADPYSGFILIHVTKKMDPASPSAKPFWQITVPPKSATVFTIRKKPSVFSGSSYDIYQFQPEGHTQLYTRAVSDWSQAFAIKTPVGEPLPVLEIHKHAKLFSGIVKRNVEFSELPAPLVTPIPSTNTIYHAPATPKPTAGPKSKPTSAFATTTTHTHTITHSSCAAHRLTISPFVAKRLLELAQLKKEMCPIVAEEFSAGNTAIMPCGHMFAQIAIEESFKKEPNKCPACRQQGTPAYV